MNKEIQRFIAPFSDEKKKHCCECECRCSPAPEDIEKGRDSHTPSTSSHDPPAVSPHSTSPLTCHHHHHSHAHKKKLKNLRPRLLALLTITLLPVFALLVVLLLALLVMYTLVPFPEIVIVGGLDGVVNASLGTLGHAVVNPDVTLRLRLIL